MLVTGRRLLMLVSAVCISGGLACDAPGGTSLSADVFPIISSAGCGSVGCHHDKANPTTHFTDYTSPAAVYRSWVGVPGFNHCPADGSAGGIAVPPLGPDRVVPMHPENSLLMEKLLETRDKCGLFYGRMPPPPRAALAANQVEIIRVWILEGAKNN